MTTSACCTQLFRKKEAYFNKEICRSFSVETEYKEEISDILKDYEERKKRKQALVGTVVSVKCAKSITVLVQHEKFHQKYNKHINVRKKFMAHDENQDGQLGDVVRIVPCRPMSKMKRHSLIDILRRPKKVGEANDNNNNSETEIRN